MSIFYLVLLTITVLIIGFSIGLSINSRQSNWWRVLLGIGCGFIVSWIVGSLLWLGLALMLNDNIDISKTLSGAVTQTFLYALISSVYGVYVGNKDVRRKARRVL